MLCINDLPDIIDSYIHLFANDTKMLRSILDEDDSELNTIDDILEKAWLHDQSLKVPNWSLLYRLRNYAPVKVKPQGGGARGDPRGIRLLGKNAV